MNELEETKKYKLYNQSCYGLNPLQENSIDGLITDPPYGISFQNHNWDKSIPNSEIWNDSLRVLKHGAYGLIFSSVRLMHRLMVDIEDSGFIIKDVLFWVYLNGMPKSKNISLSVDKELNIESIPIGKYNYKQGYIKGGAENYYSENDKLKFEPASDIGIRYKGCGLGLKPSYEPIILIQKPIEKKLNIAQNIIKYGTGALNIEETRIPYREDDGKVGHNPHPNGRVPSNIIRTEDFNDGYDKFFTVPKVRQNAEKYNTHPTLKPTDLMQHLVKLISFDGQTILDPFMGSGTTGVASLQLKRKFIGFELETEYFEICKKRISSVI